MKRALEAARAPGRRATPLEGPTSTLFGAPAPSAHPSPTPTWLEERRLATVVHAEIVGLEPLTMGLEPDAAREVLSAYIGPLVAEVEREGGTVVKHLGETLLAVFGVPKSREDDPTRAVRAARAMLERTSATSRVRGHEVGLRAGVHTGVVMVGSVGRGESASPDVSGATVSLAARLSHAAEAGQVLVGPATEPLVQDAYKLGDGPCIEVKGVAEPIRARVVLGERYDPLSSMRLRTASGTSFFARHRELEAVLAQYDLVERGGGLRVVEITGEVGLGKGYLLRQIATALDARARDTCIIHAVRPFQTAPVGFIARVLRAFFALRGDEPRDALVARVERKVAEAWGEGSSEGREAGRVLAAVAAPEPAGPTLGTELAGGDGTLAASTLAAWLRRLAERAPVCVMVEQVDWTDCAVLEQLAVLLRALRKAPVFLVFTSRPNAGEELPSWLTGCEVRARIELAPFSPEVMASFVDDLFRNVPGFPREIKRDIVQRAEGNPEMCRQLVRLLVDRGAVSVDAANVPIAYDARRSTKLSLPDTVRGVLQARIDGLSLPQKELLKLASVVGRVFWVGALLAAAGPAAEEEEVLSLLDGLRARDLVRAQPLSSLGGEREYTFTTQALRDAAYELVPRATAVSVHKRIAEWLGGRGDPWEGAQSELALHLEAAGEVARSRRLYLAAARRSAAQSGYVEAVEHMRRALASWPADAPASERLDRAGVRREKAAAEAKIGRFDDALASLDGAAADLAAAGVPPGDAAYAWIALERGLVLKEYGRIDPSLASLDEGVELARSLAEGVLHVRLYSARAFQRAAKGRVAEAKADLAEGRRIGDGFNVRDMTWQLAMARLEDAEGLVHVHEGELEAAARSYRTALEHREQAGDAQGIQDAHVNLGGVAFSRGDFPAAITSYEKALASAKKMRWASREALGYSNLGQARLAAGDAKAAIAELETACRMAEDGGYLDILADSARALAEAQLAIGAIDLAISCGERSIGHAELAKSPFFEAMAHGALMDALLVKLRTAADRGTLERAAAHRDAAVKLLRDQGQARLAAQVETRFLSGSAGTVLSTPT
jgi:class 3 adenylate cyclase/tetratricopeptide (TPR) repeat protein